MRGDGGWSALADPVPVEVHHAGTWYPGELLGWRHEPDGRCRVRVRCVVDGLRRTAWVDLPALRPAEEPPSRARHAAASAGAPAPLPRRLLPRRPDAAVPLARPRGAGLVEWATTV
ncbi:hypothetical protein [Geodermatophilus marinus]|uniref:hypothetical protein n=1 Tax=Geodermatophilus sp. LHW52908 TaxID=2303986 RepID=UPI000E3C86AF|nr:hypothetical protein [Geodermatophilus sp. LHW52908]RFU21838.1 hypothetical protein D0Z06_09440 [Geodermatophilus sp. LHW52908]